MSQSQAVSRSVASVASHGSTNSPALLIRTLTGQITQWSPEMAQRYGFTSGEATGRMAHQLLRTMFLKPLHEIQAMLLEQNSWSGGLIHRRSDGRPLMTVDHWYIHDGIGGDEPLITELHSDFQLAGTPASDQLADIIGIAGRELSEPLTAITNDLNAADHVLQPDQVARIKDGMALFHELGETLRPSSGTADTHPTEPAESAPASATAENDHP